VDTGEGVRERWRVVVVVVVVVGGVVNPPEGET